jgi:hypothetical protein
MGKPVVLPDLCPTCLYEIVHGAGLSPSDPWRAATVVVSMGLFQAASSDSRVWGRCSDEAGGKKDASDLSLVLAEIGCLGCFKPKTRKHLTQAIVDDGLSALAQRVRTTLVEDLDREPPDA